ncbi:hypothetical protein [Agaribacterium haliotis]|uniref:hypothetical protein n=1 Tax=Agaribacterium haliotis TaxID=2013869 RepID=UPI000BB54D71|nr:hypothetical protein [Agaribacterium haliotis]
MSVFDRPKVLKQKMRQRVRNKAISRAETRILLAGRKPEEFSEDELEIIVAEEEDKLYGAIKEKGLIALAAALGLGWWL